MSNRPGYYPTPFEFRVSLRVEGILDTARPRISLACQTAGVQIGLLPITLHVRLKGIEEFFVPEKCRNESLSAGFAGGFRLDGGEVRRRRQVGSLLEP